MGQIHIDLRTMRGKLSSHVFHGAQTKYLQGHTTVRPPKIYQSSLKQFKSRNARGAAGRFGEDGAIRGPSGEWGKNAQRKRRDHSADCEGSPLQGLKAGIRLAMLSGTVCIKSCRAL